MNQSIDLEAAKAAFFASGGQIIVLDGFQYVPFRPRKHPDPKPKVKPEPSKREAQQESAQTRADMIAELARTMTCSEVAKMLEVSPDSLYGMAKRHGFSFVMAPKGRVIEKVYDEEMDASLAERITALRDIGASKNQAIKHLAIGHSTMARIVKKFGIEFQPAKKGPKK
ncbi:transposase family protein [Pseudomonas monteilii]|uniref:transposase family protein n=1 Tax=Pseudomonas monteilii TaxID=76759 RepID=UPI0015F7E240|nr:transposase family protein [Pseudomonas monteilii]MBA6091614.1 transposase family protein [Pseudomonas monteilii]